jgi:hypothetical protein
LCGFHPKQNVLKVAGDDMGFIQSTGRRIGIAGELLSFFASHKRWWMLPMIVVVLLVAILIVVAQSSALAPFIYALF